MSTATTRRAALRSGVAALAAGLAAPAVATVPERDAELQSLVATLNRQWDVTEVIADEGNRLPPGITPQSRDQEHRLDEALSDWWETADQIAATPARSPIGLRAKAEAMQKILACMTFTERSRTKLEQLADADINERMAWSLAADLLAGSAVA